MPQYNEFDEIGFDDVIEEEDGGFTLLPAGAYEFVIAKITRGRYNGSDKVPACGEVNIEMKVGSEAAGTTTIITTKKKSSPATLSKDSKKRWPKPRRNVPNKEAI